VGKNSAGPEVFRLRFRATPIVESMCRRAEGRSSVIKDMDDEAIEIFRELNERGKAQPNRLDGANAMRVKWLMCRAKEKGYSNERIHRLTHDRWSINTIKQWTKNVGVKDSTKMERIDETIRELIQTGSSMNDVREYIDHKKSLQQRGLTHEDEVEFMTYIRQSPEELDNLLYLFGHWKKENLNINELMDVHNNMIELKQFGYSGDIFLDLKMAAKGFDPQSLLKAINRYNNLPAIDAELKKRSVEVQSEEKRLQGLKDETSKLETRKAQIKGYLDKHAKLTSQGFTEQTLDLLLNVARNYGGVENVVKGLNAYQDLQQLLSKAASLEQNCQDSESRLKMLNSEYADLKTVIAMCDFLLKDRKMSIQFISQLIDMAKQYGDPLEVLKTLTALGGLENIERKRDELLTTIKELEKKKTSAESELSVVSQQLAKTLGDIKALENDLNLARVFYAAAYFPKQNIEFALKYAILMVGASKNLCIGGNINPKVKVGSVFTKKYPHYAYDEFEVMDLFELLLRALTSPKGQGGTS